VIDPITLDETKETVILEKEQPVTLEWKDDKENNRFMGVTPLFTDSNYIYAISHKKPERGKFGWLTKIVYIDDEEEEEKDEANAQ
jgi:hypothetical protein